MDSSSDSSASEADEIEENKWKKKQESANRKAQLKENIKILKQSTLLKLTEKKPEKK